MNSKNLKRLLKDESGQAATEYVLLLVVLVTIIIKLGGAFKDKVLALVNGPLRRQMQSRFFASGGVHRFPLKIQ
ncbi:MAG: hypothetical protein HY074_08865 [Deltaproteobacteria bacterium]|nr:hypothetical protein [Deltaproteobacteria bacterium]